MIIITLITDYNNFGFANYLKPSCNYFNLRIKVLESKSYENHRLKDKVLFSYLKDISADTLILFTDGYDTAMLADEEEIYRKYRNSKFDILFSGERNCWPYKEIEAYYPISAVGPLRFLNSGGFIGKAGSIRSILEKYHTSPSCHSIVDHIRWIYQSLKKKNILDPYVKYKWSNQFYWHQVFLKNQSKINIDTEGEIFYSLSALSKQNLYDKNSDDEFEVLKDRVLNELQKKENRIFTPLTQKLPCHVHFNGQKVKELMKNETIRRLVPWYSLCT